MGYFIIVFIHGLWTSIHLIQTNSGPKRGPSVAFPLPGSSFSLTPGHMCSVYMLNAMTKGSGFGRCHNHQHQRQHETACF